MSLIVKIGADVRAFDREMNRLMGDVRQLTGKLGNQGMAMTQAVTLPLAGVGAFAIKTGMDFEAAMSQVKAASGASGKELQSLEGMARELGKSTKYSGTEAALGMTELLKAGQNTKQAMASIPGVLSLASAGELEVADAAAIAATSLAQFGLGADQADRIGNVLSKTANTSKTSVSELASAMSNVGTIAAANGMDFETTNAILGIFANKGIEGANAGDKLRMIIAHLGTPSKDAAKQLDGLGVAIYDANGKMRPMTTIIGDLSEAMKGMDQESRNNALSSLFGADAIGAANIMLGAGKKGIEDYAKSLKNSKGYADDFAKTLNDNVKGKLEAMMGDLEEVGITIFQAIAPALEALIAGVSKLAGWFSNLSPTTQGFIMALSGLLMAVGPLLIVISMLITAFATVKAALIAIEIATWGAIGIWVLIAVAVAALAIAIFVYWDEIKAFTIKAWGAIKEFMIGLWDSIVSIAKTVWGALVSFFSTVWQGIVSVAMIIWEGLKIYFITLFNIYKTIFTTIWNVIVAVLTGIWNGILAVVVPIFNGIMTVITAVWNVIWTVTSAVWGFIWQYLVALWTALMYFVQPILNAIGSWFSKVWNDIKTVSLSVWGAIKSFLTTAWNGIKAVAMAVWGALKSWFVTAINFYIGLFKTVWGAIKNVLTTIWNAIKSAAIAVWNAIKNAVMGPINTLKSMAISAFNGLKSQVSSIFNSVKSTAMSIWNSMKSSILSVIRGLVSGAGGAFKGLKTTILNVWSGIKSGIRSVINGIIGMINKFIGAFNAPAKALNKIPGVKAPTIGKVPMLATGGSLFGSGQAIVGEAGPELISKSGSSVKVTPLSAGEKARGIGGATGGSGVSIQIAQLVIREEADIQKVAQQLNKIQERANRASGRVQL